MYRIITDTPLAEVAEYSHEEILQYLIDNASEWSEQIEV